jgi:hypothetical protein
MYFLLRPVTLAFHEVRTVHVDMFNCFLLCAMLYISHAVEYLQPGVSIWTPARGACISPHFTSPQLRISMLSYLRPFSFSRKEVQVI